MVFVNFPKQTPTSINWSRPTFSARFNTSSLQHHQTLPSNTAILDIVNSVLLEPEYMGLISTIHQIGNVATDTISSVTARRKASGDTI